MWKPVGNSAQVTHTYLPSSLSFLGPYLSMTMPRGRVMALSRKEPTVKAKFSISSWAWQLSQPFTQLTSSSCPDSPAVPLVTFSVSAERERPDHRVTAGSPQGQRGRCTFSHSTGNGRLVSGPPEDSGSPTAGLDVHVPKPPGMIMQRFFGGDTDPLVNPTEKAMLPRLRKCTQSLTHKFSGFMCPLEHP